MIEPDPNESTEATVRGRERTLRPRSPVPADEPDLVRGVHLSKFFSASRGPFAKKTLVRAMDDVTLGIAAGETVGVVGESGSGKTTLGRLLLRLTEPTQGRVYFEGRDISYYHERDLRPLRRHMQILFQDASSSLDLRLSVEEIVAEPLRIHQLTKTHREEQERVRELLGHVELPPELMDRRPHELSSGEAQRVALARALALEPRFLVCDEPMAALDAREQLRLVGLLQELQRAKGYTFLFISHDARLVLHVSQRLIVMYAGRVVESGPAEALRQRARHPYTRALLHAVPEVDPARRRLRVLLDGEPPSPFQPSVGCVFYPRCPQARAGQCDREAPPLVSLGDATQQVACWYPLD